MLRALSRVSIAVCTGLLCASARADVHVVATDGSGDFTNLAAAFAAAADGDTVLVRPGHYNSGVNWAALDGKGLTVVGDVGGVVTVHPLRVINLPADSQVVLRNLRVEANGVVGLLGASLSLISNDGPVHVEACELLGLPGTDGFQGLTAGDGQTGLWISQGAAVSLSRCTITGGDGTDTNAIPFPLGQQVVSDGGVAMVVSDSDVTLHRTSVTGGRGGHDAHFGNAGGAGARGLTATGSRIVASDSAFTGGAAGQGVPDGPHALGAHLSAPGTLLRDLGSTFTAGSGDPGLTVLNGPSLTSPGTPWDVRIDAPLRTGEAGTFEVEGPANGLAVVFHSLDLGYVPVPHFQGSFLVGDPLLALLLLDLGPTGQLSLPFTAPVIPAGLDDVTVVIQGLMDQGAGGIVASGGATLVLLAPGT